MGKVDGSDFGKEYLAERKTPSYPDLLTGRESAEPSTALTAEAKIRAWQNSPEYTAFLQRTAEAREAGQEAQRQADLADTHAILERARVRQASEATAITEVAGVTDGQAAQIERVVGTV